MKGWAVEAAGVLAALGLRYLGLRYRYLDGLTLGLHVATALFFIIRLRGDVQGRYYQRNLGRSVFHGLGALEMIPRLLGQELAYLILFPVSLALLPSRLELRRSLFAVAAVAAFIVMNVDLSWDVRGAYVVTLAVFWTLAVYLRLRHQGRFDKVLSRLKQYESESLSFRQTSGEYAEQISLSEKNVAHQKWVVSDRDKILEGFVEMVFSLYQPWTCCLYTYDEQARSFRLKASRQSGGEVLRSTPAESEGVFSAAFAQEGITRMIASQWGARGLAYYEGHAPVQVVWMLPVVSKGRKRALLLLDFKGLGGQQHALDPNLKRWLEHLSLLLAQTEASVAHFRLREEVALLYRATQTLGDAQDIAEIYRQSLKSLHEMSPCVWALGLRYRKEEGQFSVLAELGNEGQRWLGKTIPALQDKTVLSWVLNHQRYLYFSRFHERSQKYPLIHPQWPCRKGLQSAIVWPIRVDHQLEGLLIFGYEQVDALPRNIQRLMSVYVAQVGTTVHQRHMIFQLEQLATQDGLTGVYNHRAFQDHFNAELERSRRQETPLSLLMLDIDHFKKFNDEYGHRAGDFVLAQVAQTLATLVRRVDTLARYGGEEFSILLPNTRLEPAVVLAMRIVEAIAKKKFTYEGIDMHVTVSVGVASYPLHATQKDLLIEYADRALYEAKRSGRNRAVPYVASSQRVDLFMTEKTLVDTSEEQLRRRIGEVHARR